MNWRKGQATLEYVVALAATVLFIGLLLSQIDTPIKRWWDKLATKIASPCPTPECVKNSGNSQTVP